MPHSPKLLSALAMSALLVGACSDSPSSLATAPSTALAKATSGQIPPDAWVFHPAQLPAGFAKYECIFGHPGNVSTTLGPNVACQSKQWGTSGIYREQARDLVALGPRAQALCGGPAHFDVTRVCSEAWIEDPETPWGEAGDLGCVRILGGDLICGVA